MRTSMKSILSKTITAVILISGLGLATAPDRADAAPLAVSAQAAPTEALATPVGYHRRHHMHRHHMGRHRALGHRMHHGRGHHRHRR